MTTPEPEERRVDAAWAALAWGSGLGPAGFWRFVREFGSPEAAIEASWPGLRSQLRRYERELTKLRARGMQLLSPAEETYPALLRDLRNPPPVLCALGDLRSRDDPSVAIVGTRRPSEEGADMAHRLAAAFAGEGITVVSGLARGCDTAAHRGALAGVGRTIAILGCGITRVYPPENHDLAGEIAATGAILSATPPDALPSTAELQARNALIAALARATVVVEAGETGGALKTAGDAHRFGRRVYAVEWDEARPETEGTRRLISKWAEGLRGVEGVAEIAARLREDARKPELAPQPALPGLCVGSG